MRRITVVLIAGALLVTAAAPAAARPGWKKQIDELAKDRSISISVRDEGEVLYRWNANARRRPASVEKLLLAFALLDAVPAEKRITTTAYSSAVIGGVVQGDLWLVGRGDPTITGGSSFGDSLPFEPTRLGKLAKRIAAEGVTLIEGGIVGSTGYFARDWWAPGWKDDFPARYIPRPTALSFDGNVRNGDHPKKPEQFAARSLKKRLQAVGVEVLGKASVGVPPTGISPIARVRSVPLRRMLQFTLRKSSNFFAEVFGKRLGLEASGTGSIAAGAEGIEAWATAAAIDIDAFDSSGLSYDNRAAPHGLTALLSVAEDRPWGEDLRGMLPTGGQGSLRERLKGVQVRAKTGTLTATSALAGWVWLERTGSWAEFAILSAGMPKSTAANIEDRIVRKLANRAR